MSQKVVVAQYHAPEAIFKIPKGIDLKRKTKVENWYVFYNTLYIKFVDKSKMAILFKSKSIKSIRNTSFHR